MLLAFLLIATLACHWVLFVITLPWARVCHDVEHSCHDRRCPLDLRACRWAKSDGVLGLFDSKMAVFAAEGAPCVHRARHHLDLAVSTPPFPSAFQLDRYFVKDGLWYSTCQAGWPAVLAAFSVIGLPMWLATPVIGIAMIVAFRRLAREIVSRKAVPWSGRTGCRAVRALRPTVS